MSENRKYAFTWDAVMGNMDTARPNLGPTTRIEVYRLFQFTLRDIIEQYHGTDQCDTIFREAGMLAGKHFYQQFCSDAPSLNELLQTLQELFKSLGIGLLRLEVADPESLRLILTVDEDLDCSGMPDADDVICIYDEGFLQGILQAYTGKPFVVKEIDCWCTGERTCRFSAVLSSEEE